MKLLRCAIHCAPAEKIEARNEKKEGIVCVC